MMVEAGTTQLKATFLELGETCNPTGKTLSPTQLAESEDIKSNAQETANFAKIVPIAVSRTTPPLTDQGAARRTGRSSFASAPSSSLP
jgi:hypothetical protein